MWSLRLRPDGKTFYLTFDISRRPSNKLRGEWVYVGRKIGTSTPECIRANERSGYFCVEDDQGCVRVLVLED
jgi:hypothetical protein